MDIMIGIIIGAVMVVIVKVILDYIWFRSWR